MYFFRRESILRKESYGIKEIRDFIEDKEGNF